MSIKKSINQNNSLWLNLKSSISAKSSNKYYSQSFELSLNELDLNKIFDILSYIDLSHFLIQSIKKQNDIFKSETESEYKSTKNYHKIKEIDYAKLLIFIREKIDFNVKTVLINDSCFFKEVNLRLEELDELIKNCFFLQVNNFGVSEEFDLTPERITDILYDCNTDLLELDASIFRIFQEWSSKQLRNQKSSGRNKRLSKKVIYSLHNDVIKYLQLIGKILNRLFNGSSQIITYFKHFKFSQDFLLEFHSEIDERQYVDIVNLKHFHYELEQKTLYHILELKEIQQQLNSDNDNNVLMINNHRLPPSVLTPIAHKKLSILTSTPYNGHKNDHISAYFDDIVFEDDDEPSILSLDSGILPLSENDKSLGSSQDTFDIVPFTDEENEKNQELKFTKRESFDDSDCFGSMSTNSDKDIHVCLTSTQTCHKKLENSNIFVNAKGFDNFYNIINSFHLTKRLKEDIISKVNNLIFSEDTNINFDSALRVTLYVTKDNPAIDLMRVLSHLEKSFFSLMNTSDNEMSLSYTWSGSLTAQDNNNACSPNFLNKLIPEFNSQNDQNTNNNANSKDDDSADHYSDSDELLHDQPSNVSNDSPLISESLKVHEHKDAQNICDKFIKFSTWQQYDNMMVDKTLLVNSNSAECSLILEDIDLALRLSELHLKSEFEREQCNDDAILKSKCEIIKKFINVKEIIDKKIEEFDKDDIMIRNDLSSNYNDVKEERRNDCCNYELKENEKEHHCDTIDEIEDELKTEIYSEALMDTSDTCSRFDNSNIKDETKELSLSKNVPHDNEFLSFSQRISLTISLTQSLLNMTHDSLNHMSSMLQDNENSLDPKRISKKIHAIYSIRKRLCALEKSLSNLKYSIKFSYNSETNVDFIAIISDLISDSNSLIKFSYKLEDWIRKANLQVDNDTTETSYLQELPNDLLVKLDHINAESIISVSVQRLHKTISALSYYPCFYNLMKSSFKKFVIEEKSFLSKKLNKKAALSNSELMREIHKFRRIAAICALNIVDLHVLTARMDEDQCNDLKTSLELKELLLLWGMVDKECHRLLRCNSLIQHVLMDTRRTYVEIISLSAIILSIMRTVDLSSTELTLLTKHMDNIQIYKLRINEWLEEVEMCCTVIHEKPITNTRFKCYEDIHNYLEENLKSISELSDNITIRCHKSVESLTTIISYCSDISPASVIDIDTALNTKKIIDIRHFSSFNNDKNNIQKDIVNAIVELEITENKISYFQELLAKSKELFLILVGDTVSSVIHDNHMTTTGNIVDEDDQGTGTSSFLENNTRNVTEKVLVTFTDNDNIEEKTDNTDQQISTLTSIAQNDQIMCDTVEYIVDDITSMMTALSSQNILTGEEHVVMHCMIIFNDISCQLGDKALHVLIDNISLNQNKLEDKSNDLIEYFSEQLTRVLINNCMFSLSESSSKTSSSFIDSCVSKLQQKICQRLFEKSILYIAKFASSYVKSPLSDVVICDEHFTEERYDDLDSPSSTYRLSKKVQPELYSQGHILVKHLKIHNTNILSLRNDKGECLSNDCKTCAIIPKIKSEKVSKLVAHFDRSVSQKVMFQDQKIDRICCTSVIKLNMDSLVKELIHDSVDDLPTYKRARDSFIPLNETLSLNVVNDVTEKYSNVSLVEEMVRGKEDALTAVTERCLNHSVEVTMTDRDTTSLLKNYQHSTAENCEINAGVRDHDDDNVELHSHSVTVNTAEIIAEEHKDPQKYIHYELCNSVSRIIEHNDCVLESSDYVLKSRDYVLESRDYVLESRDYVLESRDYALESRDYVQEPRDDVQEPRDDVQEPRYFVQELHNCDVIVGPESNLKIDLMSDNNEQITFREHYQLRECLGKLWLCICAVVVITVSLVVFYNQYIDNDCHCFGSGLSPAKVENSRLAPF